MKIKEYAKTSKIPLKTLRWMERIKTISDPLPDKRFNRSEIAGKTVGTA